MQPELLKRTRTLRFVHDDVQAFDVRWDQALLSASDIPFDVILEGLHKSKKQDRPSSLCTIKEALEMMGRQVIYA